MNVQNQININQTINLDELGLIPREEAVDRRALSRFYDDFEEQLSCFAAITDLLSGNVNPQIDTQRMYFLWSKQEDQFRDLLTRLDDILTA